MAEKKEAPQGALAKAIAKYNVPEEILTGVYGIETSYGTNVKTSSAGAMGHFQFIPATARAYNYPLTNTPSARQFEQQADSAAHYLSDLHKQYGNWDEALKHYSGGGYGLKEVQAKSGDNSAGIIEDLTGTFTDGAAAVADAISFPQKVFETLMDIKLWIRVFSAIFGGVLVYFGLKQIVG